MNINTNCQLLVNIIEKFIIIVFGGGGKGGIDHSDSLSRNYHVSSCVSGCATFSVYVVFI